MAITPDVPSELRSHYDVIVNGFRQIADLADEATAIEELRAEVVAVDAALFDQAGRAIEDPLRISIHSLSCPIEVRAACDDPHLRLDHSSLGVWGRHRPGHVRARQQRSDRRRTVDTRSDPARCDGWRGRARRRGGGRSCHSAADRSNSR